MKAGGKQFYGADLAALHAEHFSGFVESAAAGVIAMLRSAGVTRGRVLDVGCGAGQLSSRLRRSDYEPIGLDVSAAMVRLARQRVPKARFMRGSVVSARLPRCAAAVAVGEVFNYLSSERQVLRALQNVYGALRPGGVLIFDVKEPLPGKGRKQRIGARWGEDWAVVVTVEEDPRKKKLTRRIVTFRKEGKGYRREDETHTQILMNPSEVLGLLRAAGFRARVMKSYGAFKVSADRKVMLATKE